VFALLGFGRIDYENNDFAVVSVVFDVMVSAL
jgi:hypothetical protein